MVEFKLDFFFLDHILYKKQDTLFPNISTGAKVPVHNPMATDF